MIISPYHGSKVLIRNKDLSAMGSSATVSVSVEGKSHINLEKTKDFFALDFSNSKSNSYRMTIHLEYLPPRNCLVKMYIIGL